MTLQLITQLPTTKGDVSCLQFKAIRRNLQGFEINLFGKNFVRYLSGTHQRHRSFCFYAGLQRKIAHTSFFSEKHRTIVSHFLNDGRWDSIRLEKVLKKQVVDRIYRESRKSGSPVFCIVDDTIASHAKPSSQAKHPIEAAYFHQSHLKKRQNYGHQAVSIMLACNNIS